MSAKPLLCRLGRHQWRKEKTEDGNSFRLCQRCNKVEERWPSLPIAGG